MLEADLKQGLTFDDVLLLPSYSDFLASEVDTRTRLTRKIDLHIPILSAAMDTVTESATAIVMAQEGGLGIIHKNMSADAQAAEVLKVKKFESGMIVDPVSVDPDDKLIEVLKMMRRRQISGVPVTRGGKLLGLLTNRDIRFETNLEHPVSMLMTPRETLVTVSEGIALDESKQLLHKHKIEKLPVVDKSDNLIGLVTLKDIEKTERHPNSVKDQYGRLRVGAAVGVGMGQVNRVDSARLSVERAGDRANGSVAASDAFFPFPDGLEVLLNAGVRAVVQPGGSVRDEEVIAAAKAAGATMYLTGTRHFFH